MEDQHGPPDEQQGHDQADEPTSGHTGDPDGSTDGASDGSAGGDVGRRAGDSPDQTREFDGQPGGDAPADRGDDLDTTRGFDPFEDDTYESGVAFPLDPDATRFSPTISPRSGDPTTLLPPTPPRSPDQTAVGPTVPEGWQGRATVRSGGQPPPNQPDAYPPGQSGPGRAWWLPILLGVIGLLLIVGIAYGLVLATRHHDPAPAPTPTPTSVPTSAIPSPTQPPSRPPSTPPSTTALVTVPEGLTSLDLQGAEEALTQSGLKFAESPQTVNDPGQVGRVLSADPPSGTQVAPGTTITLTFGVAPSPSPSPSVEESTGSAAPSPSSS